MNNEEKILAMLEKHGEMLAQMQSDLADVKGRLKHVEDVATHTALTQETIVVKRLDALAEGQDIIEKRLDTLDEVKKLAEETSDKVDVIHAVVSQHSGSIAKLKKA